MNSLLVFFAAVASTLQIETSVASENAEPVAAAQALAEKGRYSEAIDALTKIIEGARDRATLERAYFERAEAWHDLAFQQPGQDELLINALADYTRAVNVYAHNQLTRRARATVYSELGAYAEALEELAALERLEASTAAPFWSLVRVGGLKRVLGDYDGAIKAFDQAIANHAPEPAMPPNYHKAITLLKMKEPERALAALDEGLKAQTDFAGAYEFRACANAALGRYDEAIKDLDRSDEISAGYPAPEVFLASVEHDRVVEAARRLVISDAASGTRIPTQAEIEELCFASWWMTHFQRTRERSALLPTP